MTSRLFPSGHASHPQWRMAAALVVAQLRAQMALPTHARAPALGLVYITDHYADSAAQLLEFLEQQLPEVKAWSGTTGVGVAANNAEYFDEPALSVMLCDVPAEQWRIFSGVAPLPRVGRDDFLVRTALVHADDGTPDLGDVLREMAGSTSSGHVFGGVVASRGMKAQFARDLAHAPRRPGERDSGVLQGGMSGVAFAPSVQWVSRITHGCQPVGPWSVVTASQDNLVLELDGVPALDVLLDTLGVSLDGDPQPAIDAVSATMAGLMEAGARATAHHTGHFGAQARVRDIIGFDTTRRGVALAEMVETGSMLAFCRRQQHAARSDLMRICAEIREELEPVQEVLPAHDVDEAAEIPPGEGAGSSRRMLGAVYVSCSGRGGPFFGGASAELQIVRRGLGDVPLVGFFANGEIFGHTLYGYTGVLTVFLGSAEPM
ncbi:MAG: FIST C-terminal domain-containing protein [Burkholderiaceae bacterium]|nr:FIST C-terminal domain-containing protein [Burkholderiaceae bacterium]